MSNKTMGRKKIIALLKSGDFTVASHDYGQVSIYKGKHKGYNSKKEMPEFPDKELIEFNLGMPMNDGYMQEIVSLMTEALGGSNGGSA